MIMLPNMGLVLPTIGVDTGLTWEQDVNANSTILDSHNHSPGSGVQITPSGLNINANLSIGNNSLIDVMAVTLANQISGISTPISLYASSSGNLFFNDGSSNIIQITSGGNVNATASGISSGTATASFVSYVLVVNAASNTPANIQGGSILLGNNVTGSHFLTLSPPSALAASYSLTLPLIPAAASFVTMDTSGNFGTTALPSTPSSLSYVTLSSGGVYSTTPKAIPTVQSFLANGTQTGTLFTISTSTTCGIGDTYTNNGNTYTVLASLIAQSGQVLFTSGAGTTSGSTLTRTSGSGTSSITFSATTSLATYTAPSSPSPFYIVVESWGGGGGGSGSGSSPTNGTNGNNSFFGANLILTGGGGAGIAAAGTGGSGGTNTISGGTTVINQAGSPGGGSIAIDLAFGGMGGGGTGGVGSDTPGQNAAANSGNGGSGGGTNSASSNGGTGGGQGGYSKVIIGSPSATYVYAVAAAASGGNAGTNGRAGGNGAAGKIIITEYYS